MFKNLFILLFGGMSLLLVMMAVSKPFSTATPVSVAGASDFYQRHLDWILASQGQTAVISVSRGSDLSDYYLRHPELNGHIGTTIDNIRLFHSTPWANRIHRCREGYIGLLLSPS